MPWSLKTGAVSHDMWCILIFNSSTKRTVLLSTTEAETYVGVTCVQDMLYMKNVLESLGLKVKLPVVPEMDNQGVVCIASNWSV
jgi:hypothetical protein